jgi:hypothetical protein
MEDEGKGRSGRGTGEGEEKGGERKGLLAAQGLPPPGAFGSVGAAGAAGTVRRRGGSGGEHAPPLRAGAISTRAAVERGAVTEWPGAGLPRCARHRACAPPSEQHLDQEAREPAPDAGPGGPVPGLERGHLQTLVRPTRPWGRAAPEVGRHSKPISATPRFGWRLNPGATGRARCGRRGAFRTIAALQVRAPPRRRSGVLAKD